MAMIAQGLSASFAVRRVAREIPRYDGSPFHMRSGRQSQDQGEHGREDDSEQSASRQAHTHTHTHTPQTSDMPIAGAMIANSYVRHSNLCWDYTIQQLARLMN